MDAIDILGSILGRKTKQGGRGGDVLTDVFKRGGARSTPPTSGPPSASKIQKEADELEDLLNVANDRSSGRRPAEAVGRGIPKPRSRPGGDPPQPNERAMVLIRAMIGAAKADGRLDDDEQEKILRQLGNPTPEAIQFLRDEFARPTDLRELLSTIPIGMEQQVYTMSLIAIDLDTGQEAKYLMELADALRLSDSVREQIHQRLGAPSMYR